MIPSWVAASESFRFSTSARASLAPGLFSSTSCSMRVQRTETSANSIMTKNAFAATSNGTEKATSVESMPTLLLDVAPAFEGAREGHLVRILEVAAHGHAARDARDAHAERREQLR